MEITEELWDEKYVPVRNHIDKDSAFNGTMFETFGAELEYINTLDYHFVWTWYTDDCDIIESGRGTVNRMGYFVSEVPWKDGESLYVDLDKSFDPEPEAEEEAE
jgi:hypothetical protein